MQAKIEAFKLRPVTFFQDGIKFLGPGNKIKEAAFLGDLIRFLELLNISPEV